MAESFWHFDLGNATVLIFVLATYWKVSILSYQHKLMWNDFERRKGISSDTEVQ